MSTDKGEIILVSADRARLQGTRTLSSHRRQNVERTRARKWKTFPAQRRGNGGVRNAASESGDRRQRSGSTLNWCFVRPLLISSETLIITDLR